MSEKTIGDYIAKLPAAQQKIFRALDILVRRTLPYAEASIKWSQPVYSTTGPCCFIKAHKQHVGFGFWWGAKIDDPRKSLEGSGDKMRHIKVRTVEDIDDQRFASFIQAAAKLNEDLGDPTKTKA